MGKGLSRGCRSASPGMLQPLDTSLQWGPAVGPRPSCCPPVHPVSAHMEHLWQVSPSLSAAVSAAPSPRPGLAAAAGGAERTWSTPWHGGAVGHRTPAWTHSWAFPLFWLPGGAEIQRRSGRRRIAQYCSEFHFCLSPQ